MFFGNSAKKSTSELWRNYKLLNDEESRNQLVRRFTHLVTITVGRIFTGVPYGVERDDLVSAGVIGLIKAIEKFDPTREVRFETYAITMIRGAILETLRYDDWVPRSVRDQQKQLKQAYTRLEAQFGRPATDEEVATEMGITLERLDKMLIDTGRAQLISLEELINSKEEDASNRKPENLYDNENTPIQILEVKERKRSLAVAIDRLPYKERTVLSLYYHEGFTFREIGKILAVSETRAYQIHAQAVIRLQGYLESKVELFR